MLPATSLNSTYTVFAPSPPESVQAFVVAYVSHGSVSKTPSLLIRIIATPERASVAERARLTAVEAVKAALEFTSTLQDVGGVLSTVTVIPAEGVSTLSALSVALLLML